MNGILSVDIWLFSKGWRISSPFLLHFPLSRTRKTSRWDIGSQSPTRVIWHIQISHFFARAFHYRPTSSGWRYSRSQNHVRVLLLCYRLLFVPSCGLPLGKGTPQSLFFSRTNHAQLPVLVCVLLRAFTNVFRHPWMRFFGQFYIRFSSPITMVVTSPTFKIILIKIPSLIEIWKSLGD